MQRHDHVSRRFAVAAVLCALTATAAHGQDIPLASIQAMTGPAAFAGVHYQNAIRLAVEEFNQKGGVSGQKIRLIEHDSLGLAPVIIADVFRAIQQLNREGMTIFLVEQNARLALETAHRAAVLEQGRIVKQGDAGALVDDPEVAEHYFGQAAHPTATEA